MSPDFAALCDVWKEKNWKVKSYLEKTKGKTVKEEMKSKICMSLYAMSSLLGKNKTLQNRSYKKIKNKNRHITTSKKHRYDQCLATYVMKKERFQPVSPVNLLDALHLAVQIQSISCTSWAPFAGQF